MSNDATFNFNLENIDMFRFQEKDFREEKKRLQQILLEQQVEISKNAHPGIRNRRAAAMNAIESAQNFHSLMKQGKPSKEPIDVDGSFVAKPKKDTSISVNKKHFEF
jgi:hypothetical protein